MAIPYRYTAYSAKKPTPTFELYQQMKATGLDTLKANLEEEEKELVATLSAAPARETATPRLRRCLNDRRRNSRRLFVLYGLETRRLLDYTLYLPVSFDCFCNELVTNYLTVN